MGGGGRDSVFDPRYSIVMITAPCGDTGEGFSLPQPFFCLLFLSCCLFGLLYIVLFLSFLLFLVSRVVCSPSLIVLCLSLSLLLQ